MSRRRVVSGLMVGAMVLGALGTRASIARGQSGARQCRSTAALVPGVSIGGVRPGMTRADIARLGVVLRPEGVPREGVTGWVNGAMLVLLDSRDVVNLVSYDVSDRACLRVGRTVLNGSTTIQFASGFLGRCTLEQGSGGNALECSTPSGAKTFVYDSFGRQGSLNVQLRR